MTFWVCRRHSDGKVCLTRNEGRKKKCERCGKPKPKPNRPKHLVALETSYEDYIALNGGERCGICLRPRSAEDRRKLDRDHDHRTGRARGLLCWKCNRALHGFMTPEWLRAAADYLERASAA